MTNKSAQKKHGMSQANALRPKSKTYKRKNKAKARIRSLARQQTLQTKVKSTKKQLKLIE